VTSRLADVFAKLRADHRTGLVTYVTGGDPDAARSAAILRGLDRAGADVLEVGIPFSDPLADGPVIQRASERALAGGATLSSTLDLIADVRADVQAAVVVFSYVNPIFRMGTDTFAARAAAAGVDGVLVLDLPIEEAGPFRQTVVDAGIDPIFLLSPTTTDARIRRAAELGRGFLYGISRLGVTGVRSEVSSSARTLARRIRAVTSLPVAVGFGLSRPEHVRQVGEWADAAVVGSALVDVIARKADSPDLVAAVQQFVTSLKQGDGDPEQEPAVDATS
jgi:tryptophan synthase alpha chain